MRARGVETNARLTGYVAVVLALPLGFTLIPPVLLKLDRVGYRFARYYAGGN
jgi:hypothetical protein